MAAAPEQEPIRSGLVALTGATGYVGCELLAALTARGIRVRCLARDPVALESSLPDGAALLLADLLVPSMLPDALAECDAAYYLVHSMRGPRDYAETDREAARSFGAAAKAAGVQRIIYLGGLARPGPGISHHLASRLEVGQILRDSGVRVIEFRASVVIGPGSLSFEIMRALVERLPVMITPRWVRVPCQPIAADDLLEYLLAALDMPAGEGAVIEIGGAEAVSYGELMREYARQRGLRRLTIPVPVLTPWLSSLWLWLLTPVQAQVGRRLIEGLSAPTVVTDKAGASQFGVRPKPVAEAVRWALAEAERRVEQGNWRLLLPRSGCRSGGRHCPSKAPETSGFQRRSLGWRDGHWLMDSRSTQVPCDPESAFEPIRRIGGKTGWYCGSPLWRLRGLLDRLAGGPGLRCVRTDPVELREGDTVDSWRVVLVEPGRRVRLCSEMEMPGRAWLEFEVTGDGPCTIRQTALFDPKGLTGLVYWYAMAPFHSYLLPTMLRRIARRAVDGSRGKS
jgi:uncharacterized protein YbjT (DUF2867 family)